MDAEGGIIGTQTSPPFSSPPETGGEQTGDLLRIYRLLHSRFGDQHWWPGDTPFEVVVGAVLTQNTNWLNVEKSIANLKHAGALNPVRIIELDGEELAELIRSSGFYRSKSASLKAVVGWFQERCEWKLERLEHFSTDELRRELLTLKGIGPETADSILLYALGRPVFVVDAYTRRIMERVGLLKGGETYSEIQALFTSNLPSAPKLFNDYHAQLVRLGKEYCRKKPLCVECPLLDFCSYGRAVMERDQGIK